MKTVITYGTFDLLHQGHINLLRRAKALGDRLIVGVTSDAFDRDRGKLNVRGNVMERVRALQELGIADEILIEDYQGQKIDDIRRLGVDIFAIGSDWEGKFDYLREYCDVVYLPRTQGISSTQLREESSLTLRLGIVGTGRIARRFEPESKSVSGVTITAVYNPDLAEAEIFAADFQIENATKDYDRFLEDHVDAVYIASPHQFHYRQTRRALEAGKHVLCEIPLALDGAEAEELYTYARERGLVLLEASKTAFFPAWGKLLVMVKSGIIGDVVDVKASLSKLVPTGVRELQAEQAGGSMTELASFPLMAVMQILGRKFDELRFFSKMRDGVDIFTRASLVYPGAVADITLGLGVKTEGNLVISGTRGYVLVPSPWWLTNYFEVNFEDRNLNKRFFYAFVGEGLRYELQEFVSMIFGGKTASFRLTVEESVAIADVIGRYRRGENLKLLI